MAYSEGLGGLEGVLRGFHREPTSGVEAHTPDKSHPQIEVYTHGSHSGTHSNGSGKPDMADSKLQCLCDTCRGNARNLSYTCLLVAFCLCSSSGCRAIASPDPISVFHSPELDLTPAFPASLQHITTHHPKPRFHPLTLPIRLGCTFPFPSASAPSPPLVLFPPPPPLSPDRGPFSPFSSTSFLCALSRSSASFAFLATIFAFRALLLPPPPPAVSSTLIRRVLSPVAVFFHCGVRPSSLRMTASGTSLGFSLFFWILASLPPVVLGSSEEVVVVRCASGSNKLWW